MADTKSIEAILSARDQNFTSTMNKAMGTLGRLSKAAAKGVGFGSFMAIGQKAVNMVGGGIRSLVRDMDQTNAAWTTFTSNMKAAGHSTGEIKKATAEMKNFASKSIYYSSDMASTYAQLDAVGTKNTANLVKGFGAVASAAENPTQAMKSMSQQATQMAAKPTVAWQDFKIMMEQTPAGIAQVAKQMGISTKELVASVQDGSVKTKDFFSAISKIGGDANHQLMKNATHYKTIGEAISGTSGFLMTKLAPAWSIVSKEAIKALGGIQGKISKIDPKVIEKKAVAGIDKAKEIYKEAKPIIKAIGTTMMGTGKAVMAALPYLAKIAPVLAPALVAFKGFQKASGVVNTIKGIASGSKLLARFNKDSNDMIEIMQKAQLGASSSTGAFAKFKGAIAGLASPAGIATGAIVGISAAAYAWHKHMEGIPGTSQNLAAKLRDVSSTARDTSQSFDELKKAQREQADQGLAEMTYTQKLKNELDGLVNKNGEVKKGYESRAKFLASALSQATGVEMKYTDGVVQGYARAEAAIDKYIAKKRAQILLESNEGAYKKAMKGQIDAEKAMQKAQETEDKIVAKKEKNAGIISARDQNTLRQAQATQKQAIADNQKYAATIEQQEAAMAAVQEGNYKKAEEILAGHYTAKNNLRNQQQAKQKAADQKELADMQNKNAQIANSMKAGMGVEAAVNQMVTKAKAKGIEVPRAVANGIKSGQYQLPATVAGMQNLVKFTKLQTKAQKAGIDVPKKVKEGISSGKMKPSEAVTAMNNLLAKKTAEGTKKVGNEGKKIGSEYSKGTKSGSSKAVSTAGEMTNKVTAKLKGGASKAAAAGRQISAGFAQGMNAAASAVEAAAARIVAAAERAAAAKAKIASPSKLFAGLGRYVTLGFAKGITDSESKAQKAGIGIATAADQGVVDYLEIHSPSKKAKKRGKQTVAGFVKGLKFKPKTIAKSIVSGFRSGIKTAKTGLKSAFSEMDASIQKWIYTDLETGKVNFRSVGEKAYKQFEAGYGKKADDQSWKITGKIIKGTNKQAAKYSKIAKAASKKAKGTKDQKKKNKLQKIASKNKEFASQVKSARDTMVSQYESAFNDMTDKAKQAAQEQIDAISDKYDQLYQDLKQKRDNFYSKLSGYDSLFASDDALKDSYGFMISGGKGVLKNFDEQTETIRKYAANLNKLKAAGVSVKYLEEATQNLSAADGLKFTNQLMAEGMEKAKAYASSYDRMIAEANKVASTWYKSDFEAIKSQYSADITKVETDLKAQLDSIAKNTMSGFVQSLNREIARGGLGKAGKKAANQIIKALKKKLGIHSPSKVTAQIGMYTAKGMAKGLERNESMVSKALDNIVQLPVVRMPEMRSAVGAEVSGNYNYGSTMQGEIVVITQLDGKTIAETTAPFTEEIIEKRQRRENRKQGRLR